MAYIIGLMMLICILSGCGPGKLENCHELKANDPQIIQFANKCAINSGEDLNLYEAPIILLPETPDYLTVFYDGKDKRIGNHFSVMISRVTCKCRVMPGM